MKVSLEMTTDVSVNMPFTHMKLTMPPQNAVKLARYASHLADQELKYSGFLLIKCPHCGKIRGFFVRHLIGTYHCECGEDTKLENLRIVYQYCQCGNSLKYMTNITEPEFDFPCNRCGRAARFKLGRSRIAYKPARREFSQ